MSPPGGSESPFSAAAAVPARRVFGFVLAGQVLLLLALGWHFRDALNPDAVAYLELARHYADGQWQLAVSGYWGAGLIWGLALLLKCGLAPLVAARLLMGLSALLFLWGARCVYEAVGLSGRARLWALTLTGLFSAWCSVQFITPDLLQAAVWLFVVCLLRRETWWQRPGQSVEVGLLCGLAYLIKAIALPVGVLLIFGFAVRDGWRSRSNRRRIALAAARSLITMLIVASPWIVVLSVKYQRLTFSTTPAVTHTLTGPNDVDRYHPYVRAFYLPQAGRITNWEEPSLMSYHTWSPWENWRYARHQAAVVLHNIRTELLLATSLNLGALWLVWAWWRGGPGLRRNLTGLLILPAVLALVYLPCYFTLAEQRFFYVAFPLLYAGVWLTLRAWGDSAAAWRRWQEVVTVGGAALPLLLQILLVGDRGRMAGQEAIRLAGAMQRAGLVGLLAGSANLPGGRTGLYVAFHLQQPWCGDKLNPTPTEIARSPAQFFFVRRASALARALAADSRFQDLDQPLDMAGGDGIRSPVQVFGVLPAGR